jgi:transcription initiation factor TFIIIB Brf1 subunit/transcription initiation factor TFIIB
MFLELRMMPGRQYSIAEFLKIASNNGNDADNLKKDFMSTMSHMQKEHGYKLCQPTVDTVVSNIAAKLGLPPKIVVEGNKIAALVHPHYKGKGIKSSGIACAIIILTCNKHGILVCKRGIMNVIQDIRSPSTVQYRLVELRSILESIRIKIEKKLVSSDGTRKIYLEGKKTFIDELLKINPCL